VASNVAEQTTDLPVVGSKAGRDRPRRTRRADRTERRVDRVRSQARAQARPAPAAGWEWGLAVVGLFLLSRSPVLFYRERVAELFDLERATGIWPDDTVLRLTFTALLLAMYVLAARTCDPRTLLRQPFLLIFLAWSLASVTWSIEPGVSLWRVALFGGTAIFGWYLGERYPVKDLVSIVGAAMAIGALVSVVALAAWPDRALATNRVEGLWSGAYVNRNLLGHAMAIGLVTLPFLWSTVGKRRRAFLIAVGLLEMFLLLRSGSRTPWIALGAAAAVGIPLLLVRKATTRALKPAAGAFAVGLVSGYAALIVQWNWNVIVNWLDRSTKLSGRTLMWSVVRYYHRMQPWRGWGFEALWAHPPTIAVAQTAYGKFPYSSHSGYLEVLISTGWIGLAMFTAFLAFALWRSFRFAWEGTNGASLWPLVFIVFALVANVSESLFVSAEATWALTVAAAVAVARARRRRPAVS
jgi:exopolysaccharide production protein ExoQ